MSDQQEAATTSQPPAKKIRFGQGQLESTEKLYQKSKFPDVHFSFATNDGAVNRVPAHKCLLAAKSDVFEKMFYGDLKEEGDVAITDVSDAAFNEFLQFFYLSEVELSAEHVASVLYLGHKYNVEKCVEGCVKIMTDGLTNENVCTVLPSAILYDHEDLVKACGRRIRLNTTEVFASTGFLGCDKEALAYILRMNLLSCSEVDVFEACMAWVRGQCNQRVCSITMIKKHLGDLYNEIRFASMTIQEFCTLKAKHNTVFSSSDFEANVRLIAGLDSQGTSEHSNTSSRQAKWDDGAIIVCGRDMPDGGQMGLHPLEIAEKIIFSTNEPLLLGSFRCNEIFVGAESPRYLKSHLSVKVVITEARTLNDSNSKVLSKLNAKLHSDFTTVLLPQPVLIRPDFFYTICIEEFPKDYSFRLYQQQSSVTLKSNIEIQFHNDKTVDGKIVGLIFQLLFNEI